MADKTVYKHIIQRVVYLFGSVGVGRLSGHEIEEGVEEDEAAVVRIDDGHDALEVDVALLVLAERVAQADEARFELVGLQVANAVLVEVIERASEFVQLLLCDSCVVKKRREKTNVALRSSQKRVKRLSKFSRIL